MALTLLIAAPLPTAKPLVVAADTATQQLTGDAECHNTTQTAISTISCSITTLYTDEVAVLQLAIYSTTTVSITVKDSVCSGGGGGGTAWSSRFNSGLLGKGVDFIQFCRFPSAVSNDKVSVTISPAKAATMNVFTVVGENYSSPWAATSSVYATGTSSNPSVNVTTHTPYDFIFAQVKWGAAPPPPINSSLQAGFQLLGFGAVSAAQTGDEGAVVTTTLTNFPVGFVTGTYSAQWTLLVDRIQASTFITSAPSVPHVLVTANDSTVTRQSSQNKVFQAEGQIWTIVHVAGVGLECTTSSNGQQFSSPDILYKFSGGNGGDFDTRYNSSTNTLYVAAGVGFADLSGSFYFQAGTLPSSNPTCGGISWIVPATALNSTGSKATAPSVTWDSKGYTHIALNTNISNFFNLEVWNCNHPLVDCATYGNWSGSTPINTTLPYVLGNGFEPQMGEFNKGDLWVMYGTATNSAPMHIYTYNYTSTTWSSGIATTNNYTYSGPFSGSGVSVGNELFIANPDSSGHIHIISCTDPCSSLTDSNTTVANALTTSISTDRSNELVVTYSTSNQTNLAYIKSTNLGTTWGSVNELAHGFTGISIISLTAQFYITSGGNVTLLFTDNAGTTPPTANTCTSSSCNVDEYYYNP